MGTTLVSQNKLPMAQSQQDAETLLQQTYEALQIPLQFKDIYDIIPAVEAVTSAKVLNPIQLNAVVSTLEESVRLSEVIMSGSNCSTLKKVTENLKLVPMQFLKAVRQCVDNNGSLLDRASERLAQVRQERRENMEGLRKEIEEWSQIAHNRGISERPIVVIRRDRLCIPIKSGRQSELPKGSMTLDSSGSGSTIYVEPASVIDYNNFEAVLKSEEEEEEGVILTALSSLMAQFQGDIRKVVDCVAQLDIVYARAGYATWMGGKRPILIPEHDNNGAQKNENDYTVRVSQVRHPLLLEASLPKLTEGPDMSEYGLENNFMGPLIDFNEQQEQNKNGTNNDKKVQNKIDPPTPIDIIINQGVSVVAVTGPNTGGKTAMLKTLGLCILMTKAGLFLPVLGGNSFKGDDTMTPRVQWFDQVLADIGDGQSLQQNLSTFSGHITRIVSMLKLVTDRTLVLLDEVGSGTNPQEGAALAAAVLKKLSSKAKLVVATTHHSELKEMANNEPTFINASVEFDLQTLRPMYNINWGTSGASNALAIARSKNFDRTIINMAQDVVEDLHQLARSPEQAIRNSGTLIKELSTQIESTKSLVQQLETSNKDLENQVEEMQKVVNEKRSQLQQCEAGFQDESWKRMESSLQQIIIDYKKGKLNYLQLNSKMERLEKQEINLNSGGSGQNTAKREMQKIKEGSEVKVISMMGKVGRVVSSDSSGQLVVKVGALTMEVSTSDVIVVADKVENEMVKKLSKAEESSSKSSKSIKLKTRDEGIRIQTKANTLNVIGMEGFQAILEVELYLASSLVQPVFYVVHGIGKGKVRQELHEWLGKCQKVKSFSLEDSSMGGTTEIILK